MSLISALVNQTISYIYSVATNRYGDATETTIYSDVPCRFVKSATKTVNEKGEEVLSSAQVWLLPTYTSINTNCHVKIGSRTYRILTIEEQYDLDGILDHMKVFLT